MSCEESSPRSQEDGKECPPQTDPSNQGASLPLRECWADFHVQDAVCPHVHEWQAAKGLSKADLQLLLDAKSKEVEEAGWPSFDCVRSFPASPPFSFSCFRFPSKAKEVEGPASEAK